jgi:uncharacterized membrane protein
LDDKSSDYDLSSSTILTSRFGYESARLIHLAQKNLYIIIGLIGAIVVLSILNIFGALDYFPISGEKIDKIVDIILLLVLIIVLVPLTLLLLRSRNVLDRWTEMFERNSIATGMTIAMNKRSREEAIHALAQSVDEIGESLEEYITSKKSDLKEFYDVSIDDGSTRTRYDILIDSNHVVNGSDVDANKSNSSKNKSIQLKKVLEDYGAVIMKIVDGHIDKNIVESFVGSLSRYASVSKKRVGLGIIIGEESSPEAKEAVNNFISKRGYGLSNKLLLLIDKPSYTSFNVPTAAKT